VVNRCSRFISTRSPETLRQQGKGKKIEGTLWQFCTAYRDDASGCNGENNGCPFYTEGPVKDSPPTPRELEIVNL
jgi:hypothetical protein